MLPDNSVDAILTDPPYEIGFMGNAWDRSGIAYDVAMWREALRVLKPGGHILAFSGSRTYHRMTCAIEDAGAEIRDSIMWVYGSGFPKSLDISKALDKLAGADRQVVGQQYRAATGRDEGYGFGESFDITAPATLAAQIWEGWGTALKPAHEPICVARKPLALGTVAANVLAHGVGGLNIGGCRVDNPDHDPMAVQRSQPAQDGHTVTLNVPGHEQPTYNAAGRWPANFIHDGSPEVLAMFPADMAKPKVARSGLRGGSEVFGKSGIGSPDQVGTWPADPGGSAARFYQQCAFTQDDLEAALFHYCAKASKREKGADNTHPTVKPIALGRHLARLICPPGGTLLDLFAGSGSFGVAAKLEGFGFVGFELDDTHATQANKRMRAI